MSDKAELKIEKLIPELDALAKLRKVAAEKQSTAASNQKQAIERMGVNKKAMANIVGLYALSDEAYQDFRRSWIPMFEALDEHRQNSGTQDMLDKAPEAAPAKPTAPAKTKAPAKAKATAADKPKAATARQAATKAKTGVTPRKTDTPAKRKTGRTPDQIIEDAKARKEADAKRRAASGDTVVALKTATR